MRHSLAALLLVGLAGHPRPSAPRPVTLPSLAIHTLRLPNGLCALLVPEGSSPVVTLEVWYHVGSKDERPGQTGFAHLFEHLMFQGTTNIPAEAFSSYIVRAGAVDNAFTTEDATVFWETVPSSALPVALWLEADRMRNLKITNRALRTEREVVDEERQQKFDNAPYGTVLETLYRHAFTVHPYQHVPIGSTEDIDHAALADVRQFYRNYYVPANATLVLTGAFNLTGAQSLVVRDFSVIPAGAPISRHMPLEPPQTAQRIVKIHRDVALPAVVEGFHIPADGAQDAYPLKLVSNILSQGESSRLYRALVYQTQVALEATSDARFTEDPNLFLLVAVLNPGHLPAEAEAQIDALLRDLRDRPVSAAELDKAKNEMLRDSVLSHEGSRSLAEELGYDAVILGHPNLVNAEAPRFLAVTPAQVQRVARQYLVPSNRTVVEVYPKAASSTVHGGG